MRAEIILPVVVVWLFGGVTFSIYAAETGPVMDFLNFDTGAPPMNKTGAGYPNQYGPEGSANVQLDDSDAIRGRSIRFKDENTATHEVRYAFDSIHEIGWEKATPAPDGSVKRPGRQGYNGMLYSTTKLPLAGQQHVYLAIKPEGAGLFSEIALPLRTR